MNVIRFIEFLRPNGEVNSFIIDTTAHLAELARKCEAAGARFTWERIPGKLIALVCEFQDEDLIMRLAQDDLDSEDFSLALSSLVTGAYTQIYEKD